MLLEQADKTREGLQAFETFAKSGNQAEAERVGQLEREEDELRRILIDDLNRTFVTPIDREDIYALSRAVDDMIDYAYTTIDEMQLLHVEPNEYIARLAAILPGPRTRKPARMNEYSAAILARMKQLGW